jgi:hypothetical protein
MKAATTACCSFFVLRTTRRGNILKACRAAREYASYHGGLPLKPIAGGSCN